MKDQATPADVLREWHDDSARLGGRDTMLHFRESRDGSIDLSGAHPSGLAQLLAGRATRLSSLVRDQESLSDARRRAKSIRGKAEQLRSERALEAAHLAIGIVTWNGDRSSGQPEINGPVLLRHVTLAPRGQRVEDFEVRLADDVVVNPALVRYLEHHHGLTVPENEWVSLTRRTHGFDATPVLDQLRRLTKPVPGFLVSSKLVISTFADIQGVFSADPLPESHPLLLALAGDERARGLYSPDDDAAGAGEQGPASGPAVPPPPAAAPKVPAGEAGDPSGARAPSSDPADGAEHGLGTNAPPAEARRDDAAAEATAGAGDGAAEAPSDGDADGRPPEATGTPAMRPGIATDVDNEEPAEELPVPSELPQPLRDNDPSQEFLVIDVDGDQQSVVDAALEGQNLVVDTPPGTGATQLAVAVTAALAYEGKRVLFVGQSADALEDFAARMGEAGLDGLAIDGRANASARRDAIIARIASNERTPKPEVSSVFSHLYDLRAKLAGHTEALHRVRAPWGVSAYTTMEHLARLTAEEEGPQTTVRLPQSLLVAGPQELAELRARLEHLASLGAFSLGVEDTVWFGAQLADDREAEAARETAERIGTRTLPDLGERMVPLLKEAELNPTRTVNGWGKALDVLMRIRRSLDSFSSDIYEVGLDDMIAASGNSEYRTTHGVDLGLMARGRLKKLAREYVRPGAHVEDLHSALIEVRDQKAAWREVSRHDDAPKLPRGLVEAHTLHQELAADLERLEPVLASTPDGGNLAEMDTEELRARMVALGEDRDALHDLPERGGIEAGLRAEGLGGLLEDLSARKVPDALVGEEFDLSWWASVLQAMAAEDPAVGGHDGVEMHRAAAEFRLADRRHIELGAQRLLYELGRRWKAVIAAEPDEAATLRATLRSDVNDLHALTQAAPTVVGTLAPVWMASPLQVPALVAAGEFFDTLVIADAGRVSVPEILPSLSRSTQVIALGDDRLLGPGDFSVGVDRRRDPVGEVQGPESIFTKLSEFLPTRRLHYSYRTSPVGLVTLANRHFYGNTISTLPQATTGAGSGIEFAYIAGGVGVTDTTTGLVESTEAEVDHVVQMVMRHARTRSRQSLAVVTLSPIHAQKVAVAIQRAIRDYPYVAAFFSDRSKEPFVVTDTERIRGLSRDFIIFSLGYGRTQHGRIMYNLGRLSQPGGERVLATAITRARRHLAVVSCFEADDLDQSRLRGGAVMLPQLLADIAASSGRSQLLTAREPGRDPLLADISDRLIKSGVMTYENYGGIDLAVANSAGQEHGMVVAVEGDGPGYASIASIRERERVRPERLARRGWRHVRVWSTDAFVDPQAQADSIFNVWRETVEELSPQSVLDAARVAAEVVRRRGSRPKVALGLPVHAYSDDDFAAMLDWILSDGVTRTDDDLRELLRGALAIKSRSQATNDRLAAAVRVNRERSTQAKQARQGATEQDPEPAKGQAPGQGSRNAAGAATAPSRGSAPASGVGQGGAGQGTVAQGRTGQGGPGADTAGQGGTTQGGTAQGGTAQGGTAQGGTAQSKAGRDNAAEDGAGRGGATPGGGSKAVAGGGVSPTGASQAHDTQDGSVQDRGVQDQAVEGPGAQGQEAQGQAAQGQGAQARETQTRDMQTPDTQAEDTQPQDARTHGAQPQNPQAQDERVQDAQAPAAGQNQPPHEDATDRASDPSGARQDSGGRAPTGRAEAGRAGTDKAPTAPSAAPSSPSTGEEDEQTLDVPGQASPGRDASAGSPAGGDSHVERSAPGGQDPAAAQADDGDPTDSTGRQE